jgi:hypothetical protein
MARKASSPSPSVGPDPSWQAEDDHRTLMQADDIRSDPSRLRGVRKHTARQLKKLTKLHRSLSTKKLGGSR